MLDGIPLDQPLDAIAVGMVVPVLVLLDRRVFDYAWTRMLIGALVTIKLAGYLLITPNGFCVEFRPAQPVTAPVSTIDLDEPSGLMRSWDVRAHWGSGVPLCSAIMRRDYPGRSRFPAWFLNILHNTGAPQDEVDFVVRGVVTVSEPGTLSFELVPAAGSRLTVDGHVASADRASLTASLNPGSHHVELRAHLAGNDWRLVPAWNGRSLWQSAVVTIAEPSFADVTFARGAASVTAGLTLLLIACWLVSAWRHSPLDRRSLALVAVSAVAAAMLASIEATARFAPLAIGLALCAPAARGNAGWRNTMWLIGVPWFVLAATLATPRVGEFMLYSRGDDWLTYQVSAYRIYLQGYWLEAGEKLFYYQPLYRWIAGAIHVVFGDSSAGETFWDGACLFVGALLAFFVCRPWLGGRAPLAAAVVTLTLFTVTPIWYLIGRGLAEISAAGFAWTAALLLIRARRRAIGNVIVAAVFGVLAFYARLNQMLFAGAVVVFLLPASVPARALRDPLRVLRSMSVRRAVAYVALLVIGVALFTLRAWFYTGHLNPFAGTSFGLNRTGLAPNTLFSPDVWEKVFHSLFTQMIVNEVFDPRGLIVYAGCMAAALAVLQVPWFSRLPLALSLAILGGLAGALAAHAHGYPGRFAVHLVPLAAAMATIASLALTGVCARHAPTLPLRQ